MIYLFSGLGADRRAYSRIRFNQPVKHIEWTNHVGCKTIEGYAARLLEQIDPSSSVVLIGVSFGGMVAQAVAKLIKHDKLVVISSVQVRKQIPLLYRLLGFVGLQYVLPASFLQNNPITFKLFGIKSPRDKKLLQQILDDTDLSFLKWAIIVALKWNPQQMNSVIHVHGSNDKIIPLSCVSPDYVIKGGGHFMIVEKAKEIETILNRELSNNDNIQ